MGDGGERVPDNVLARLGEAVGLEIHRRRQDVVRIAQRARRTLGAVLWRERRAYLVVLGQQVEAQRAVPGGCGVDVRHQRQDVGSCAAAVCSSCHQPCCHHSPDVVSPGSASALSALAVSPSRRMAAVLPRQPPIAPAPPPCHQRRASRTGPPYPAGLAVAGRGRTSLCPAAPALHRQHASHRRHRCPAGSPRCGCADAPTCSAATCRHRRGWWWRSGRVHAERCSPSRPRR